jgi:hypothetical protein
VRDEIKAFEQAGIQPYGVNPAGVESHWQYAEKMGFNFPLLSDPDRAMARAYQALKEDDRGIVRTAYVIARDGRIAFARRGAPPVSEIVAAVARWALSSRAGRARHGRRARAGQIGLAVARGLGRAGARVVIGGRDGRRSRPRPTLAAGDRGPTGAADLTDPAAAPPSHPPPAGAGSTAWRTSRVASSTMAPSRTRTSHPSTPRSRPT